MAQKRKTIPKVREYDLDKMTVHELIKGLESGNKDYRMIVWCVQAALHRGTQRAFRDKIVKLASGTDEKSPRTIARIQKLQRKMKFSSHK